MPASLMVSADVAHTRPGRWEATALARKQPSALAQVFGKEGIAAVTAIPRTVTVVSPRSNRSATWMPRAPANPASTTTPPGCTQPPCSSVGRSTDDGVGSRPSTSALPVAAPRRSRVHVTGNGPL